MSVATFDKFLAEAPIDIAYTLHPEEYLISPVGCGPYAVSFIDAAFLAGEIAFGEVCLYRDRSELALEKLEFLPLDSKFTLEHIPRFLSIIGKDDYSLGKNVIVQLLFRWRLKNCV